VRRIWKKVIAAAGLTAAGTMIAIDLLRPRRVQPPNVIMPDPPTPSSLPPREPARKIIARDDSIDHDVGEERSVGASMPAFSFNHVLLGLGVLFTLVVGYDIVVRGAHRVPPPRTWTVPGGDPQRGRMAIIAHGCGGCHVVPGIRGASGRRSSSPAGLKTHPII
jgi:hypothetical protein